MADLTTIPLKKGTRKALAVEKAQREYRSYDEMLVEEFLQAEG